MNYANAKEQTIGVRELIREVPRLTKATANGATFVVMNHARPIFKIVPVEKKSAHYRYTLDDIKMIQFRSRYKNLSKDIDKIVYGV